jgi:hypothetical protein
VQEKLFHNGYHLPRTVGLSSYEHNISYRESDI